MKKGEAVNKISAKNRISANLEIAFYGRFAGTKALAAVCGYEQIAHTPKQKADSMKLFAEALEGNDDKFFSDVAELIQFRRENDFPVSSDWTHFAIYIASQKSLMLLKRRFDPITIDEVRKATGFSVKKISKMASDAGIKLVGHKRGPKRNLPECK